MSLPELRIWRTKLRGVVLVAAASSGMQRRKKSIIPTTSFDSDQQIDYERRAREEVEEEEEVKEKEHPLAEDWVTSIKEKLDQHSPNCHGWDCWRTHCIFKVPTNIQEIDPKAYIPQVVSIGPYHRGMPHLQDMEKHKWRLLRHVLERKGHQVELYLEVMAGLEEKTRRCYAQPVKVKDMGSREFIEMMLLDACFVLELITASVKGFIQCGYSWVDPIFTSRGVLPCIQRDFLMLENQIPLFVLDRLFALTCDPDETDSVTQLALQFFKSVIPDCQNQEYKYYDNACFNEPGLHLLHIVRKSLLPSRKATFSRIPFKQENQYRTQLMMHCVTSLRDSGVKFQKKNKSSTFMDIEFTNGVLYIPPLVIHHWTKSILLNLMAFEQCYPDCSNDVTSYISFMDGLINSPLDVRHLRKQGIIDHGLGSEEEVASLVNNFCREIVLDINGCYLLDVSDAVNRYFDRKRSKWRASLKKYYFSEPWAFISLLAG